MLAGFLLVVLLLGGIGMHGWLLLEEVVREGRENNARALELSAAVQALGERGVDMERSARQFVVLGDVELLERFSARLTDSGRYLERIEAAGFSGFDSLSQEWWGTADALRERIAARPSQDLIVPDLEEMARITDEIRLLVRNGIDDGNAALLGELERRRVELGSRLLLAFAGAILVALAMGWWLVRPVRQLEQAIGRLGTGSFDRAVHVCGPADLRRLGQRLDGLRKHLAGLEADRERILRHVSHELKTPLTALKEGIALLVEEVPGPLSDGQRQVTRILAHKIDNLQSQIESLLRLNAAVFDARRLNRVLVQMPVLLQEAAQRQVLRAQARQIKIRTESVEGTALMDCGKLTVILDNLLANAIDFSPSDGEVSLVAERIRGGWRIVCSDQGPGVAPEDALRIFDPFVQGVRPPPVPRAGSGVGLSIVRELALSMHGSIRLVPGGQGAVFQLDIPDEK